MPEVSSLKQRDPEQSVESNNIDNGTNLPCAPVESRLFAAGPCPMFLSEKSLFNVTRRPAAGLLKYCNC